MIEINLSRKTIINDDCLSALKGLSDDSVDSIVTDPPYGLKFMGKKWDYEVPSSKVFSELLRVLKPGGHMLCACGTRTQHRMAVNIEDAGFEIRDVITWLYGSGFPKSMNLKDVCPGWGTALKPACEFWTLARKPLSEKNISSNVLKHGTGGLNIDACRIKGEPWKAHEATGLAKNKFFTDGEAEVIQKEPHSEGRWPANLILDEQAADALDEQSGNLKSGGGNLRQKSQDGGYGKGFRGVDDFRTPSEGGASRFFYVAKASKSERNSGCESLPDSTLARSCGAASGNNENNVNYGSGSSFNSIINTKNNHPTVKPIKLMTYLCRLITPPKGIVLDPFMGSGSTGVAAIKEGFGFIGIEREKAYFDIADARIKSA